MSTKCIFHEGDKVSLDARAEKECVESVRELVISLLQLPYVTIAETDVFGLAGYVRLKDDDQKHIWPIDWFELFVENYVVPIDDLI